MTKAFTLIEMLVVMAIIALLASIAYPRYEHALDKAKLVVLENNLQTLRQAIDHYYSDIGHYPAQLSELVTTGYLRHLPVDPYTRHAQWTTVAANNNPTDSMISMISSTDNTSGIYDVHSMAPGVSFENKDFSSY